MSQQIQPLRIHKSNALSPGKMPQRPLSELSPMEKRRNSPSFVQTSKLDSSPFENSPKNSKLNSSPFNNNNSPLSYWHKRDPNSPTGIENRDPSPRRSSIENLMRASRVKNSTMFAREQNQEYDPASAPVVDRPLASGRPLSMVANSRFSEKEKRLPPSPRKSDSVPEPEKTPRPSPSKSSLSKNNRFGNAFDPDTQVWSEDDDSIAERHLPPGKSLHRHAKSVTFDAAPPQVNEYEMATPDPSSVASGSRQGSVESFDDDDEDNSFDNGSFTVEDSFDASLEDTDKTPVVLPEDWRFMSPEYANEQLASKCEDPFKTDNSGSADQTIVEGHSDISRSDSVTSSGDRRPLPPLPPSNQASPTKKSPGKRDSLQEAAERASSVTRNLPSPPRPASISKNDLKSMNSSSMPIEERLRLMMLQEEKNGRAKTPAEEQRERRLRRGGASSPNKFTTKNSEDFKIHEDSPENSELTVDQEYEPTRISRESILRKVKSKNLRDDFERQSDKEMESPSQPVDPDVPLPSCEDSVVDQDDNESVIDQYAIPDMYQKDDIVHDVQPGFDFNLSDEKKESADEDQDSFYSTDTNGEKKKAEEQSCATPVAEKPAPSSEALKEKAKHRLSLSQFASMLSEDDFGTSFASYISPSAEDGVSKQLGCGYQPLPRPETPKAQIEDDEELEQPGTPESVIRHPIPEEEEEEEEEEIEEPTIPEPAATIKAPGGKLKTRPSLAPADIQTMAETRRKVSGDNPKPPVPERSRNRPSTIIEADSAMVEETCLEAQEAEDNQDSALLKLDVTVDEVEEGLSMGIDKEFDRLIEAQKKGYLTRQNTKLVVASSASNENNENGTAPAPARGARSAGNSPIKPSNSSATWTTEPWNGKMRRKSIRQSMGSPMKRAPAAGPAPPLPGMSSNVSSDNKIEEVIQEDEEFDESGERGRLFVKVVGVKDLELPMPKTERSFFALTLDNGLHCVTTSWLELGKTAPIGQEFELIVMQDLEFQLTLQTKIEPPKAAPSAASPAKKPKAPTTFSRMFASPRKRKEMELRQMEEEQKAAAARQREAEARRKQPQSAWELLHRVVGPDGSFARSYVSLKEFESRAYGRPLTVDVPCFNEWATEESRSAASGVSGRLGKSASANPMVQRRAPYKIGKLELQLLYVPKPKGATDEDMPKSLNACVRELAEAEKSANQFHEGHLSQQGGDCPYWRRRFFKLEGFKLTAYHEATHQPRATINLAKASKLIDDKSALMQKEASGKGGSRRKSAFAEEEEGYMFVEEGFRIRFANGETIDFYADSNADKDGWMRALQEVVGRQDRTSKSWSDMVLKREKALSHARPARPSSAHALNGGVRGGSRPSSANSNGSAVTGKRPSSGRPSSGRVSNGLAPPHRGSSRAGPFGAPPARPHSQQQAERPSSSDKALPNPHARNSPQKRTGLLSAADRRQKARSMIF